MKKVPTLDAYMPLSSPYAGYNPEKEELTRKHVEVYRRKTNRSNSPVLIQRDQSKEIRERVGKWEAEKSFYTTDVQYAQARLQYLEDLIKLQRDTVERPLLRHRQEMEAKVETLQNQLNIVVNKMETQGRELAAKDETIEELRRDKQQQVAAAKDERAHLSTLHEQHLRAEQRAAEAEIKGLKAEISDLEATRQAGRTPVTGSPANSRIQWMRDEAVKKEEDNDRLKQELQKRDEEVRSLQDTVQKMKTEVAITDGSLEHHNFVTLWGSLEGVVADSDRQRAGLRTAVAQLEMCSIGRQPGKAKRVPEMPKSGESLRVWSDALRALAATASEEAADGRGYSVTVLRRVIEAHQTSLEVTAEKDRAAESYKGLERQRLAEIERDRDEERRLFLKERERLRSEVSGLRKTMSELQTKGSKLMNATIDSNAQTETSLGALAESFTQTTATAHDPVLSRLKTDVDIKQSTIQDLSRSVETRDAQLRTLREQRERFLSFIFDATSADDPLPASPQTVETHTQSPRRPTDLAQISTLDFLTQY